MLFPFQPLFCGRKLAYQKCFGSSRKQKRYRWQAEVHFLQRTHDRKGFGNTRHCHLKASNKYGLQALLRFSNRSS